MDCRVTMMAPPERIVTAPPPASLPPLALIVAVTETSPPAWTKIYTVGLGIVRLGGEGARERHGAAGHEVDRAAAIDVGDIDFGHRAAARLQHDRAGGRDVDAAGAEELRVRLQQERPRLDQDDVRARVGTCRSSE